MLKKKKKFISKILLMSMCTSIVPATVALAEESFVNQENVSDVLDGISELDISQATMTIALKSNASTGYSWKYTVVQGDSVAETEKSYIPDDAAGTIEGSGGTDNWSFKGLKEGSTTLRFEYSRSWEGSAVDTKEFIITVDSSMNITVKETTKGTAQIQLKSHASAGYFWSYSVVQADSIAESSKVYVTNAVPVGMVFGGIGVTDIWTFKGLKEGSTTLKFEGLSMGDGTARETKYFNLTVDKELNVIVTEVADPSSQKVYDINEDGKVNLIDLVILKKYLLDNTVVINKNAADINCDGQINAIDMGLLKRALLSK